MYTKTVITRNSMYIIDELAETITRLPVSGEPLRGDNDSISFLSYVCKIGEPLRAICIDKDGSIFYRISSTVLTIGTITE